MFKEIIAKKNVGLEPTINQCRKPTKCHRVNMRIKGMSDKNATRKELKAYPNMRIKGMSDKNTTRKELRAYPNMRTKCSAPWVENLT